MILDENSFSLVLCHRLYVKAEHLELSKVKKAELLDFMKGTKNKEEYTGGICSETKAGRTTTIQNYTQEPRCQL